MTDKRIDYGKAVELFQLAIHERGPDYVYERPRGGDGCYYSDHVFESASSLTEDIIPYLKPGCAWGLALSRSHLVPLEKMAVQPGFVVAMLQDFGFEITPKAAAFMSESQSRQDAGDSWGHAFEAAVAAAELGNWGDGTPNSDFRDTFED